MDVIESALHWARQGVPVFPCGEDKRPLTANGFYDATVDEAKIRALFDFNDGCLVGGRMGAESGLFAVDFDLYKDESAREYMEFLQGEGALPTSQIHLTRSGGVHVIYRSDTSWPNCKPVDGVEVKGEGGYIILPESQGYRVEHAGIVDAPSKLIDILNNAKKEARGTTVAEWEKAVLTSRSFHDPLTCIAAKLSARGVSQSDVFAHLMKLLGNSVASRVGHARHERWAKLYNDVDEEVSRIAFSGDSKYNPDTKDERARESSNDAGGYQDVAGDFFTSGGNSAPQLDEATLKDDAWSLAGEGFGMMDDMLLLEQRMVVHPFMVEGDAILIAGHPKAGKSAISLDIAMHIACGVDVSRSIQIPEQRPVLYFALEGVRAVKLRIAAKLKYWKEHGIVPHDPQLFVIEKAKNFFDLEHQDAVVKQIAAANRQALKKWGKPIGAVFIDTLTRAMPGGDQNDASDTGQFFNTIPLLRDMGLTASYCVIHHLRKDGETRGSTNIEAEVDVIAKVFRDEKTDSVSFYIDNARSIEAGSSYTFRFNDVSLGVTQQGYKLSAPVVCPINPDEAADTADKAASMATQVGKVLGILSGLNVGKHLIPELALFLSKQGMIRAPLSKKSQAEVEVRMLLASVIPDSGVTSGGKKLSLVRDEAGHIASLLVLPAN